MHTQTTTHDAPRSGDTVAPTGGSAPLEHS